MQLSSLGACLESSAYMCFYVKRRLEYKPHTRPTYVIARETEAMKEKQLEKAKEKEYTCTKCSKVGRAVRGSTALIYPAERGN